MQDAKADNPNLVEFLERRLPELGLDLDTYGGYVLGIDTSDEDELNQVLEFLQQSAMGQDDDDEPPSEQVWHEFAKELQDELQKDRDFQQQRDLEQQEQSKAILQEHLAHAKQELAQEQQKVQHTAKASSSVDEATKQALLSRFAYENDNGDDEDDEDAPSNQQVAAQAALEKAQELRAQKKGPTKRDEQIKTKEQKANKQQLKEERRKRATKGERKR